MKLSFYYFSFLFLLACTNKPLPQEHFFIGTYTNKIYSISLNEQIEQLSINDSFICTPNPSYLCVDSKNNVLYSIHENEKGSLNIWRINKNKHRILLQDTMLLKGVFPCHISLNQNKNNIMISNYGSGNIEYIHLNKNKTTHLVIDEIGNSIHPQQTSSHLHNVKYLPLSHTEFVSVNLGTDKLTFYSVDTLKHSFSISQIVSLNKGSGPRHIEFHPHKHNMLYVVNELSGTICLIEKQNNQWAIQQEVLTDTISVNKGITKSSADIHISKDGKFLYASNRIISNTISVFSINDKGHLQFIQQVFTNKHPRNFILTSTGNYILVASRDDNSIQLFKRDINNGTLIDLKKTLFLQRPVCITLVE